MVKHLLTMRETWVQSLGWEEMEMAIHSSTLAWKIPWMEECGRLQSMGSQRVGHNFTFALADTTKGKTYISTELIFNKEEVNAQSNNS